MNHLGVVLLLWLLPLRLEFLTEASTNFISRDSSPAETVVLQDVTDDLRARLEISERVQIEIHGDASVFYDHFLKRAGCRCTCSYGGLTRMRLCG